MSTFNSDQSIDFLVRRDDLHVTRMRSTPLDVTLADGEVLLQVDRFAMTANNLTYAAFGDAMSYWDFFPSNEDGWGRIPVWGFGTVLASKSDGVSVGERFYGYFPMSTQVVMRPGRVKDSGFVDGSPHREKLHPLYNQYTRNRTDADQEAQRRMGRRRLSAALRGCVACIHRTGRRFLKAVDEHHAWRGSRGGRTGISRSPRRSREA